MSFKTRIWRCSLHLQSICNIDILKSTVSFEECLAHDFLRSLLNENKICHPNSSFPLRVIHSFVSHNRFRTRDENSTRASWNCPGFHNPALMTRHFPFYESVDESSLLLCFYCRALSTARSFYYCSRFRVKSAAWR